MRRECGNAEKIAQEKDAKNAANAKYVGLDNFLYIFIYEKKVRKQKKEIKEEEEELQQKKEKIKEGGVPPPAAA